jgi:hypothetical protein
MLHYFATQKTLGIETGVPLFSSISCSMTAMHVCYITCQYLLPKLIRDAYSLLHDTYPSGFHMMHIRNSSASRISTRLLHYTYPRFCIMHIHHAFASCLSTTLLHHAYPPRLCNMHIRHAYALCLSTTLLHHAYPPRFCTMPRINPWRFVIKVVRVY